MTTTDRSPRRPLARLALAPLALAATLIATACGPSDAPPPVADAEPIRETLRVAYDAAVHEAVNVLLTRWAAEYPQSPVESRSAPSTALSVQAGAGDANADVLIMSEQTPLPSGEHAPIAARPWVRDPIVFFAAEDETRSAREILESDDRIAIAVEASPLGQYTRFGLRKLEMWTPIRGRLLRFGEPFAVVDAVASGSAALGAAYASDLAAAEAPLRALEELVVSEAAERSFVVVTLTPEGVELARWLAAEEQVEALAPYGLAPTADRPDAATLSP
jgi:ABC-type molybdate transport system substrate-binding protein